MPLPKNKRIKRGWMDLRVARIIDECTDTRTLIFEDGTDGGRQFDYIAGQYLTFRFDNLTEKPIVRSYTMSSSPSEGNFIAVTVKEVDNGFVSRHLCRNVKVGDILRARGPIGKFCYDVSEDQENLVMVAAGSGVTPFISIMREAASHLGEVGYPKSLHLLVGYRTTNDLISWPTLQELKEVDGVEIHVTLSREEKEGFDKGRIDAGKLERFLTPHLANSTFMTCGPDAIMNGTCEFLKTHGVPEDRIKVESFA